MTKRILAILVGVLFVVVAVAVVVRSMSGSQQVNSLNVPNPKDATTSSQSSTKLGKAPSTQGSSKNKTSGPEKVGANRGTGMKNSAKTSNAKKTLVYRTWRTLVKPGNSTSNDSAPSTDRDGPAGKIPRKKLGLVMRSFAPSAEKCFQLATKDIPLDEYDGTLILKGQINQREDGDNSGQLTRLQVAESSTLDDSLFAECMAKELSAVKFPRPNGGTWAEQEFRFKILPKKAKAEK